jgi:transposase
LPESYASCKIKEEVQKPEEKKKGFTANGKKPGKYPGEIKEQAVGNVRLCLTPPLASLSCFALRLKPRKTGMFGRCRPDFRTRSECAGHVAELLGVGTDETVMNWVRQAEIDGGLKEGVTSDEREEIRRLRRENAELKRTNGILRAASAFFAAEPDRPQNKQQNSWIFSKRDGKRAVCCGVSGRSAKCLLPNTAFRYPHRDITRSNRAENPCER